MKKCNRTIFFLKPFQYRDFGLLNYTIQIKKTNRRENFYIISMGTNIQIIWNVANKLGVYQVYIFANK